MRMKRGVGWVAAIVCLALLSNSAESGQPPAQNDDVWAPLRFMLGTWDTTSSGQPGIGTGTREYRLVLRDRFIEIRTRATYPPQDKNPKGEVHEDVGFISYDRSRKTFVFRQFHAEGFVNIYVAEADNPPTFVTDAIENIPDGYRARELYRIVSPTEFVETFSLAAPGKDFAIYSETRLKKRR
jgi:nitrobindin-like protein